jgi:hypothetical protein
MKAFTKSFLTILLPVILAPMMQGATVAQVVSEQPDGAVFQRGGLYNVSAGINLMEGDVLETKQSTVILSFADGSLMTAYPNTILYLNGADDVRLGRGELLGDVTYGSRLTVRTMAGNVVARSGVYGVLLSGMGSVQVRNLDGMVSFTGALSLDTAGLTVSLVEPGKTVNIPAGEEIIVRGTYNDATEVFSLVPDGVVMAMLDADEVAQLREATQEMSSAVLPDTEEVPSEAPVIIEIPYEDIETASDKG